VLLEPVDKLNRKEHSVYLGPYYQEVISKCFLSSNTDAIWHFGKIKKIN